MKRVTIKDVAARADVSIKTVSNVINGTGSMRPETHERVKVAIRELGYVPNLAARAMKTGRTKLIGLYIFDFSQPFAPYLADKVIEAARKRGYGVIINTYGFDSEGFNNIDENVGLGADGWIFFTERSLKNQIEILDKPYPIVIAGDYLTYGKADLVTMPNAQALRTITGNLLDAGNRTIALIGASLYDTGWKAVTEACEGTILLRLRGYVEAYEQRECSIDWQYLISAARWDQNGGAVATSQMLEIRPCPDAIICLNDALAIGAMYELQRRGIRIPQDVRIIGFDNVPETRFSVPSLTTIDPHVKDYAQAAVSMVIDRIEGYNGPVRTYTTGYTLVERASGSTCHLPDHS